MEKLPLSLINNLPYKLKLIDNIKNKFILIDPDRRVYSLHKLNKNEYIIYQELIKSKRVEKCIYEQMEDGYYYLLFNALNNKSEVSAIYEKMLPILEQIFDDFKYSIALKKEHLVHLNNIYKVLDNRFTYFEMRIRELEMMPVKDDVTWVVLSKYHVLLDAKIYMYDLQQDIFSFVDKSLSIDYGMIIKDVDLNDYKNGLIEPKFKIYYGPYGMLLARYFLYFDHICSVDFYKEKFKKIDDFNIKYFCFMCLYIYILNTNLDVIINPYNLSCYLLMIKKISYFIKSFGDYVKK